MAGGGNFFQVVVQVAAVVRRLLRVAVLHDHDAPAASAGGQQGAHCHGRLRQVREQSGTRRVPTAQVAAAPSPTQGQLGQVGGAGVRGGATVVVVDAARGGAAEGVVVVEVFRQVHQVRRGGGGGGGAPEGAELVVRRLKDLLEHGGVKILTPQDVLFARLLDLDDDGDDEEDEDNAAGDTDDGPVGVVEVVQDAGFPVLFPGQHPAEKRGNKRGGKGEQMKFPGRDPIKAVEPKPSDINNAQ